MNNKLFKVKVTCSNEFGTTTETYVNCVLYKASFGKYIKSPEGEKLIALQDLLGVDIDSHNTFKITDITEQECYYN